MEEARKLGVVAATDYSALRYPSMAALVIGNLHSAGYTPCRLCALAPAIRALLNLPSDDVPVFTTFQHSRRNQTGSSRRRWSSGDETRQLRIHQWQTQQMTQLYTDIGLSVTTVGTRPVAYGFLPADQAGGVGLLAKAYLFDTVQESPPPVVVQTFWSLLAADSAVLTEDETDAVATWFLAEAICA